LESPIGRGLGRKITKGWVAGSEKQFFSQEENRLNTSFLLLLASVETFLSSISFTGPNLESTGNSALLIRRSRRALDASRLETKINRTIAFLESLRGESLIYTSEIPNWLEQKRVSRARQSEPYATMQGLEIDLRSFISSKLESVSSNWWKERIPSDVQVNAEERRRKNERLYPWQKATETHLIHFVDFPDYVKIIVRSDNWTQVFSKFFKDKEMVSAKLRELEPIRNAIAHFRQLGPHEADKLRLYASDLSAYMQARN
jgi:hypothetical protein